MSEEEAILESIWEVLERTGILCGLRTLLEILRSVKGFGEVWSFTEKVLGRGVGVKDAGRDMKTGVWRVLGGEMSQDSLLQ